MQKFNVKRIELNNQTSVLIADNGEGIRFDVEMKLTDMRDGETLDDFVLRHNGVTETINYLHELIGI